MRGDSPPPRGDGRLGSPLRFAPPPLEKRGWPDASPSWGDAGGEALGDAPLGRSHRAKPGKDVFPRQTAYNVPLELTYTAIPFVIIDVLFYFTVVVQNDVESKTDDSKVVVDVTLQGMEELGYQVAPANRPAVRLGMTLLG